MSISLFLPVKVPKLPKSPQVFHAFGVYVILLIGYQYAFHCWNYFSCMVRFLAIAESNKFPYKPIILKSYRLSLNYTSKIDLFSKLDIFKLNQKKLL